MTSNDFQHLSVSRDGDGITTLKLNRPERLNAMNRRMNQEVTDFLLTVAEDKDTRVVILTGEGRAFCSGGDLFEHHEFVDDEFEHEMQVHTRIIFAMLNCPKPVICQMNGDAVGWGATFALFSDMIFAADSARFSDPHVPLGLSTGDGAAIIWPQLMGFPRAKQFLMTGEPLTATLACQYGLVNEVHPPALLAARVTEIARKIASLPQHAMRMTKASVNIPLKNLVQTMMDTCIAFEVATQKGPDHAKALTQFAQRRQAKPQG
jgi:enoyl-CoA hydratase